jgi:putative nucleotidyltransferase with HDIG domain
MLTDQNKNNHDIPISQLKPGMYVVSVSKGKNSVSVKTQGYIYNSDKIMSLKKAGIKRAVVDPSKEKQLDPKIANIKNTSLKERREPPKKSISLDQEMLKAHKLYNNAKGVQQKILDAIMEGRVINTKEVKESTDAIVDSIFRNQDAMSCMSRLRLKDDYLIEHSLNVSILMTIFAKHLGIDDAIIQQLALGAFLHDIGKIKVRDEVLNKPGKFTPDEYEEMKKHVSFGVKILEDTPHISHIVMSMVKEHHERIDGSGYPFGITDDAISKYGRMIAIVDSYDAMTAERVYKAGMHPIKAFKILVNESRDVYDAILVEKFVQCLGVYPIGTLVKLDSGKLALISRLNKRSPLKPVVRVFYNTRLKQAIAIEEIDLSKSKYKDQIDCCIKPEEFNINLLRFFKAAFID